MNIEQVKHNTSLCKEALLKLTAIEKELASCETEQSVYALVRLSEQYNEILQALILSGNLIV